MTIGAAGESTGLMMLRVRVSVEGSEPSIWRLLDIDSSVTLDKVHEVLQAAVGWRDIHLHSFTDTDPFERLQPVDGEMPEPRRWVPHELLEDSDDDLPETHWSLGEILTPGSGPVFYEYDFGDSWGHRLDLITSFPAHADSPGARLVDGARRAPLEDSGGIGGYHDLLDALADPAHDEHEDAAAWVAWTTGPWQEFEPEQLDIDAVNNELALIFDTPPALEPGSTAGSLTGSLTQKLTGRLPPGLRREFRSYLNTARLDEPDLVETDVAATMTAPYLWLIRRIGVDGITLTNAGWLPPAVVHQAMTELGWTGQWIGKANREDQTLPILQLRESAQRLGLIRKIKGRLVLTTATRQLLDAPVGVWLHLARALTRQHRHRHQAEQDAVLLLLLGIAAGTGNDWDDYLHVVSFGLGALGWRTHSGTELEPTAVHELLREPRTVLLNLGILNNRIHTTHAGAPAGKAFARAALRP